MKKNLVPKIGDNALFETYNFTDGSRSGELISQWDIRKAREKNFYNIDAMTIIEIAACQAINNDSPYNFVVYEDGTLELGGDMAHIASNASEYLEAFEKFERRVNYNIITFEIERGYLLKGCKSIVS